MEEALRGMTKDCAFVMTELPGAEADEADVLGGGGIDAYAEYVAVGTGCPTSWLGLASYDAMSLCMYGDNAKYIRGCHKHVLLPRSA